MKTLKKLSDLIAATLISFMLFAGCASTQSSMQRASGSSDSGRLGSAFNFYWKIGGKLTAIQATSIVYMEIYESEGRFFISYPNEDSRSDKEISAEVKRFALKETTTWLQLLGKKFAPYKTDVNRNTVLVLCITKIDESLECVMQNQAGSIKELQFLPDHLKKVWQKKSRQSQML